VSRKLAGRNAATGTAVPASVGFLEHGKDLAPVDAVAFQLLCHAKHPLLCLHRVRYVAQASRPQISHWMAVAVLAHSVGAQIVD